jgi:hypothetical protein
MSDLMTKSDWRDRFTVLAGAQGIAAFEPKVDAGGGGPALTVVSPVHEDVGVALRAMATHTRGTSSADNFEGRGNNAQSHKQSVKLTETTLSVGPELTYGDAHHLIMSLSALYRHAKVSAGYSTRVGAGPSSRGRIIESSHGLGAKATLGYGYQSGHFLVRAELMASMSVAISGRRSAHQDSAWSAPDGLYDLADASGSPLGGVSMQVGAALSVGWGGSRSAPQPPADPHEGAAREIIIEIPAAPVCDEAAGSAFESF